MNAWKIILATFLIFGTGMVTGALLIHNVSSSANDPKLPLPQPAQTNAPDVTRVAFLKQVESALHLTPEEHKNIDKILQDSQDRTKKMMDPVMTRVREEAEKTKAEFRAVLSPEQQKRFDDLMSKPARPWGPPRPMPMPSRERPGEKQEKRFGRTNGTTSTSSTSGRPMNSGPTNSGP